MISWIILILVVILISIDTTCFFILDKIYSNYKDKNKWKCQIPGYNIYMYLKWKGEFKG